MTGHVKDRAPSFSFPSRLRTGHGLFYVDRPQFMMKKPSKASMIEDDDGSIHYSADHGLDECGTTISDVDGNIVFTNNLNVADRVNSRGITMVTDVNMSYT